LDRLHIGTHELPVPRNCLVPCIFPSADFTPSRELIFLPTLSGSVSAGRANMCLAAGLVPLHGLAREYARLAEETIQPANDLLALTRVMFIVGLYQAGVGEWEAAEKAFTRAIETAKLLGDWR